jgi:hypothetical protein
MPDALENLNTSVAGCQHEASVQAESAAALDAKLLGLLAFMAAAAGLLLTLDDGLEAWCPESEVGREFAEWMVVSDVRRAAVRTSST